MFPTFFFPIWIKKIQWLKPSSLFFIFLLLRFKALCKRLTSPGNIKFHLRQKLSHLAIIKVTIASPSLSRKPLEKSKWSKNVLKVIFSYQRQALCFHDDETRKFYKNQKAILICSWASWNTTSWFIIMNGGSFPSYYEKDWIVEKCNLNWNGSKRNQKKKKIQGWSINHDSM